MKSLGAMGKVGIVLLLLNEIRGVLVVISVLAAWSHAGKAAAPPPAHISASARLAPPTANAGAAAAVAPGLPRRSGS